MFKKELKKEPKELQPDEMLCIRGGLGKSDKPKSPGEVIILNLWDLMV